MEKKGTTRRRFLRATGGAAVGGTLLYGPSESAVAQSDEAWPEFGYNSKNTGYAPNNTGPLANVKEDWTFEAGDVISSSPVVVDDTVYVGSQDNTIYAINTTDGTERWRYETMDSVVSSGSVVEGTVYIGSADSTVYALDTDTGSVEWSTETGDGVTSLAVADGTVYAADFGNTLFALDAEGGSERWQFGTGERVPSQPAVVNETVYFGTGAYYRDTGDTYVYAINTTDGSERWSFQNRNPFSGSYTGGYGRATVVDGTVYIGYEQGGVHAINVSDGSKEWTNAETSTVFASPTVADETVYVGGGTNVYALNKMDGSVRWRSQTGDTVQSSPAVVSDTVYVGSDDANVYALDAGDGTERWRFETANAVGISSPAVVDGTVYVGNSDGVLYAISGDTSTPTVTETAAAVADEPNDPPTASITVSEPTNGESIVFGATSSADPDGSITNYEWEITVNAEGGGGGFSDSGPTIEVAIPSDAESVEAELTVTDDDSATDTTTRTVEFDGGSTDDSGSSVLPLLVGAGTLGAAGGGAWWYRRRDGTDTETGGGQSDGDSTGGTTGSASTRPSSSGGTSTSGSSSSPGQTSTVTSGTTSASSESDTDPSADSGVLERVNESVDEGDDLRNEARDYRDAREYDRALDTYDEVKGTYEGALKRASESDLINTDVIEQKLAAVEEARQEVHRQRLQEEVGSLNTDFDHADTLADDGDLEKAQERLESLGSDLTSAEETATQHDFGDLHDEITALEQRREERLTEVTERLQAHPIPNEIPRVPEVSVDYDELTDEEPIGGGGNADVSKATLPTPDGDVTLAIKRPRMAGTLHADAVERMLAEAETWDKLDNHDHIVGVVDYGSVPIPWIGMEYMDGGHLGERSGRLEMPQALWTALAITKGVRHAHRRGVAHLDLKPQNVLFRTVEDAWDVPKVADWGLSKHLLEHSKSVEGMSVEYAAPEQFDEDYGPADDITDIYQLGAMFYELFTERPPFEGQPFKVIDMVKSDRPTPPSEIADVPDALDEILLTALAKEKDDRYDDIVYLRDDLQELFDNW